jgi:O-antigen ligase
MNVLGLNPIRKFFLLMVIFFMPFQNVSLFGNPYLFLPMIAFIFYFLLVLMTIPIQLLQIKSSIFFLFPMILLWSLIFLMKNVSFEPVDKYIPENISAISGSFLQRFAIFQIFFILFENEIRLDNDLFNKIPKVYIFSMIIIFIAFQLGIDLEYKEGRLFLFGTNPNTLGYMALIAALFSLSYIFDERIKKEQRAFYFFALLIMIFLIGQTASRGAILSLLIGVLFFFILLNKPISSKILLMIPVSLLILLMIYILLNSGVVKERFISEAERGDLGSRMPIWKASWDVIRRNPIFGPGPSLFDFKTAAIIGRYRSQHNEYLRIIGYSGFVGLSLFIFSIFRLFNKVRIHIKKTNFGHSAALSILAATCAFMFSAGNILMTFLTWFVFAYTASITVIKEIEIQETVQSYKE